MVCEGACDTEGGGGKISKSNVCAAIIQLYEFGSFGLPEQRGNDTRTHCDLNRRFGKSSRAISALHPLDDQLALTPP